MSLYTWRSLDEAIDSLPAGHHGSLGIQTVDEVGPPDLPDLPGLTLSQFMIHKARDWGSPEVYLVGVAFDASGAVFKLPVGVETLDVNKFSLTKVKKGEPYNYMGRGLPLVLPPTKGFLAIRLLIVDSDEGARKAAEVIKAAGDAIGAKEVALALAATGVPQAAAVSLVLGKGLATAAALMEKNNDDIIDAFEGYFTAADMRDSRLVVPQRGATAVFEWVETARGSDRN